MIKCIELSDPKSCLNKAEQNEMIFVLRAKDPAAAATVRAWIKERISMGLNEYTDPKIQDAENCACTMQRTLR